MLVTPQDVLFLVTLQHVLFPSQCVAYSHITNCRNRGWERFPLLISNSSQKALVTRCAICRPCFSTVFVPSIRSAVYVFGNLNMFAAILRATQLKLIYCVGRNFKYGFLFFVDEANNNNNNNIKNQSHSENTWATYQENMQSRNSRKQPYWALHTYFGMY